jgi:hypothetical protein
MRLLAWCLPEELKGAAAGEEPAAMVFLKVDGCVGMAVVTDTALAPKAVAVLAAMDDGL